MASGIPDKELPISPKPFTYERRFTLRPDNQVTIPMPKNPDEVIDIIKNSNHNIRDLIGNSLKAHRNPYEAMIFLYGLSGAGKSSTLNHLFNSKLIPTSENKSETPEVIEYVATLDSTSWNVSGLDIGFVDTPGWGDTSGSGIKNLANIDQFLLSHPFLDSKRLFYKLYPNLVMIVARAGDPRILGINSQLSKMLRMVSKLNIIDKNCPNIIVALTCAMFIRPPKKYVEKRDLMIKTIKSLVRLHLGVDPPVVAIENLADDEELDKDGDWTLLPDGTKQPLNLFDEMISLMKASGDEIGVEAVRLLFSNTRNKIENFVARKISERGDFFKDNELDISKWERIITAEFEPLLDTELFKAIVSCVEEKRLPHLSSLTYELVLPLLHRLQEVELTETSQMSSMNIELINRKLAPFKLTKSERILLFELFQVKPLENLKYVDMLGCGFNIESLNVKNRIISSSDLKYCYEIGTHVPNFSQFVSKGRLLIHCQFEFVKESMLSPRKPTVTFSVLYELFNLHIDVSTVTFEKDFVDAASSLPKYEPDPNKSTLKAYKSFFDQYGTHCLLSLSFGGRISGSIDLPADSNDFEGETYRITSVLRIFFEYLQKGESLSLAEYTSILDANSVNLLDKLVDRPITWNGGEEKFHVSQLRNLNNVFWSCWVDSLCTKFTILDNISQLVCISNCVARFKGEVSPSIDKYFMETQDARKIATKPQVLPVSENPERVDWDFSRSKKFPRSPVKNTRASASDNAETKTYQMCGLF